MTGALPLLHTGRLVLQPRTVPQLRALVAGGDVGVPLGAGYPYAEAVAPVAALVDSGAEDDASWWVRLAVGGEVVGDCGLKGLVDADGTVEVTYGLAPAYRGSGYATEAVGAVVRWVTAGWGARRVVAEVDPGNAASVRLLDRLGFAPAGTSGGRLRFVLATPA